MKKTIIALFFLLSFNAYAEKIKTGCVSVYTNEYADRPYKVIYTDPFYIYVRDNNENRTLLDLAFLMRDDIEYKHPKKIIYEHFIKYADIVYKEQFNNKPYEKYGHAYELYKNSSISKTTCFDLKAEKSSYRVKIFKLEKLMRAKATKTSFPNCEDDLDLNNDYNYLGVDMLYKCENIKK